MKSRPPLRRPSRVPLQSPARENRVAGKLEHGAPAAANEELSAQLDLATAWYAQAMASTDWEVTDRGIRNARDTLDFAQRQLALKDPTPEPEPRIMAQCARLMTHVDRAQALLRIRIARHPAPGQSAGDI